MVKTARHILKSADVKLEGCCHLDIGTGQTAAGQVKGTSTALTTPQVCVVQSHAQFAVIEVTCSCGTKTLVRCEYADVQSADHEPNQTQ